MSTLTIGLYFRREPRGYRAFAVGSYGNTVHHYRDISVFSTDVDRAALAAIQRLVEQYFLANILPDADTSTKKIVVVTSSKYESLVIPYKVVCDPKNTLFLSAKRRGYDHYLST